MSEVPCSEVAELIERLDELTKQLLAEATVEMRFRRSLPMASETLGAVKALYAVYCKGKR